MKWKMKNNLDEMQEIKLRGIERNGCWFAFWALPAAMMIQLVLGAEPKQMAGEWIVFMCLALYLGIACMRAGIWDRHIPATPLANLVCSLIAGIIVWVLNIFVMISGTFDRSGNCRCLYWFIHFCPVFCCSVYLYCLVQEKSKKAGRRAGR